MPPAGSVPRATSVGTGGATCRVTLRDPSPSLSCSPFIAPFSAGRVLLPSPGHALPGRAALGTEGVGCRDNGSSPDTEWGQDEGTSQSRPSPSPLSPQFSQGIHWHPQLCPPVMVAASRCVALSDRWDSGLVSGQAVTGESGLGWQTGGLWRGRVSRGTGVSSLAGVTWGPGCHGKRTCLPWLPGAALAGGSHFSGPCLGERSCSGDALRTTDIS